MLFILARRDLILAIIGTIFSILTIIAAIFAVIQKVSFQDILITGYAIVLGIGIGVFEFDFTRRYIFGFGSTKLERGVYQLTSSGIILALNNIFGFVVGAFVIALGLVNVSIWLFSERHTSPLGPGGKNNRLSSEFDPEFVAKFQQHQSAFVSPNPLDLNDNKQDTPSPNLNPSPVPNPIPLPQKSLIKKSPSINTDRPKLPPKKPKNTGEDSEFQSQNLETPPTRPIRPILEQEGQPAEQKQELQSPPIEQKQELQEQNIEEPKQGMQDIDEFEQVNKEDAT